MLKCFRHLGADIKSNYVAGLNNPNVRNLRGGLFSKDATSISAPTVRIRKALSKDIPQVLKLFSKTFHENEPLINGLQMSSDYYSPALRELWRTYLEQGMSLMAIPQKYKSDSPVFGAVVNTKCCPWDPDFLNKVTACVRCPKTSDLINLWALFTRESKVHEKYNLNSFFHINHVLINEKSSLDYSYKLDKSSLSKILVGMSLQLARSRGYDVACLTTTSQHMAEVASEAGMNLIWEYPYEKLLNNDLNPIVKWKEPDTHVKVFATKF